MQKATLLTGDVLHRLKNYPDNHFDAMFCDAPYGLSEHGDIAPVLQSWLTGQPYKHPKKGFMGKDWDSFVPGPEVWKEVFRVLKPGAFALVFAGSRTQDLMGVSLRLAGFELRDTVSWLYGSGFPKSLNISKAIQARVTTGKSSMSAQRQAAMGEDYTPTPMAGTPGYGVMGARYTGTAGQGAELEATCAEAQQWDGYGTALKPAHEPCLLIQKPLDKTFANNVVKHGCGALNIDGTRISLQRGDPLESGIAGRDDKALDTGDAAGAWGFKSVDREAGLGRFPANLVLSHTEDCVCHGTKSVKSSGAFPAARGSAVATEFGSGQETEGGARLTGNGDGTETVADWECAEHCPVRLLDAQTAGKLSPGHWAKSKVTGFGEFGGGTSEYLGVGRKASDDKAGGASRFFYCAKVSTKERNAGLGDEFEVKRPDNRDEVAAGHFHEKGVQPAKNSHPTLKPLALTEYLARLLLVPEREAYVTGSHVNEQGKVVEELSHEPRRILVPFSGTASEVIGCLKAGFDEVVGVELNQEYVDIAKARVAHWVPEAEVKTELETKE